MNLKTIRKQPKGRIFSIKTFFILIIFLTLGLYAQDKFPALKIGDIAPPLSLEAILQGPKEFKGSWEDLKGKIVVLEFWATWCGPCRAAMPHLNELVKKFENKSVQFISITNEEEWRVKNFLTVIPISGWVGLDTDGSMFKAYEINLIPKTVLIDQKGKIAAFIQPNELDSNMLDRMLAGLAPVIPSNQNASIPTTSETKPKINERLEEALIELVIRPAKPSIFSSFSEGSFEARGINLPMLVSYAYEVSPVRVVETNPLPEKAYEVIAKVPNERSHLLRPILQQALDAAFGLKVRRETRETDVLILSVPKNGKTRLRPSKSKSDMGIMSDDGLVSSLGTSIRFFSAALEDALRHVVLDETHLEGLYDLALYWDPKAPESVFGAIRKQLGLELRAEKRSIEVLVFETMKPSQKNK